jgi:hypothetical protein
VIHGLNGFMISGTIRQMAVPLVNLTVQLPSDFKTAIDVEIARRRSTLRREVTLAMANWLNIPPPVLEEHTPSKEGAGD